jgi:hypothetical protein
VLIIATDSAASQNREERGGRGLGLAREDSTRLGTATRARIMFAEGGGGGDRTSRRSRENRQKLSALTSSE